MSDVRRFDLDDGSVDVWDYAALTITCLDPKGVKTLSRPMTAWEQAIPARERECADRVERQVQAEAKEAEQAERLDALLSLPDEKIAALLAYAEKGEAIAAASKVPLDVKPLPDVNLPEKNEKGSA